MVLCRKVDGLSYPPASCCGRTADAIICRDAFNRSRRHRVELEVFRLITRPEEVQVGFVPNFKVPLLDFINAVARSPMSEQSFNQSLPLAVVYGRRDVSLPPEHKLVAGSQSLRHEAQFDEGLHARFEDRIIEGINVLKVVDGLPRLVLAVNAHLV